MGKFLLVRQPHHQNHQFAAKEIRKADSREEVEGRIGLEEDTENRANKERGKTKKQKVE